MKTALEIKTLLEDVLMKYPSQETLDKVRCYVANLCDCVADLQAWRVEWGKCIASNGERCNCSKCETKADLQPTETPVWCQWTGCFDYAKQGTKFCPLHQPIRVDEKIPECGEFANDEDRGYRCNRVLGHPGNHAMLDGAKQVAAWPRMTGSDYQRGADSRNAEVEQLKAERDAARSDLLIAKAQASYQCAVGWQKKCNEWREKCDEMQTEIGKLKSDLANEQAASGQLIADLREEANRLQTLLAAACKSITRLEGELAAKENEYQRAISKENSMRSIGK